MAFSDQFTDDEWEALAGLPSLVAAAAGYADGYRPLESLREQFAGRSALKETASAYPDSALIQEIVSERPLEIGDRPDPTTASVESLDGIHQAVGTSLRQAEVASHALVRLDAESADSYRAWVVQIAERVVNTAKRGSILGIGGVKVDAAEADYLSRLRTALGLDPSPRERPRPRPSPDRSVRVRRLDIDRFSEVAERDHTDHLVAVAIQHLAVDAEPGDEALAVYPDLRRQRALSLCQRAERDPGDDSELVEVDRPADARQQTGRRSLPDHPRQVVGRAVESTG